MNKPLWIGSTTGGIEGLRPSDPMVGVENHEIGRTIAIRDLDHANVILGEECAQIACCLRLLLLGGGSGTIHRSDRGHWSAHPLGDFRPIICPPHERDSEKSYKYPVGNGQESAC